MPLSKDRTVNYFDYDGEFYDIDDLLFDLDAMIEELKRMRSNETRFLGRCYLSINVDVEVLPSEVAEHVCEDHWTGGKFGDKQCSICGKFNPNDSYMWR